MSLRGGAKKGTKDAAAPRASSLASVTKVQQYWCSCVLTNLQVVAQLEVALPYVVIEVFYSLTSTCYARRSEVVSILCFAFGS